jgi:manganese/zinc/iron transport system permease protein
MNTLWHDLWQLLTFDVPHNTATVLRGVSVLGLACGVIGTFLLLRKRSLVADAVSHATLPGVCIGFLLAIWLGLDGRSMWLLLGSAAVAGMMGIAVMQWLTSLPRVKEDAAIGVVLSVFFAVGVVLLGLIQNMPVSQKAGLSSFIFGQAATMHPRDANAILLIAILVLAVAGISFKELRLLCFDAGYARSLGYARILLDGLLMMLVMTLTVIGLHAVGVLLMVALLIIPAVAARFWTVRLGSMALLAACFGGVGAYSGAAASAMLPDVPTGPAIVLACGVLFIISLTFGASHGLALQMLRRWLLARRVARQHLLRAMFECEELAGGEHAITLDALLTRRRWLKTNLHRTLKRLRRRGDLVSVNHGYQLTHKGRAAAMAVVRSHRLWEHYLTTQADIAPSHVDRAADDIEHVLGEDLVRELEATLAQQYPPVPAHGQPIPQSPHTLTDEEQQR